MMRKKSNGVIMAILLVLVLFPSCDIEEDGDASYRTYTLMQEELIHAENERRTYLKENDELEQDIGRLHQQVEGLAAEIERTNKEENYVKEEPVQKEIPSPADRIQGDQIRVSRRNVLLDIREVSWHYLLDTNSMDPVLDAGTNVLAVSPSSPEEIKEGDIVIFTVEGNSNPFVHRVVEKGEDNKGMYYVTKGDNNPSPDSRIRYEDVQSVVVGILY